MKVKVPRVNFLFKQENDKYMIYLYDDISEDGKFNWNTWEYDESETSAKYLREKLEEIPEGMEIELYINSNGGSVKEGVAIYNQLKRHPAHKTGFVDGVAHSVAFVILQACDHRVMGEGTSALLHEMWVCTAGNAAQLRAEADQLDTLMEGNRALFMRRAKNITEEQLKEMMEKETMLTPDKALEYGFIDEIAGRNDSVSNEPMQAAKDIETLKERIRMSDFAKTVKEFTELVEKDKPGEPEEISYLDAFLNAFL